MTERPYIAIILGTSRPGTFTGKVLALAVDQLSNDDQFDTKLLDPAGMALGFPGHDGSESDGEALRHTVAEATGVLFATPEYHGSFSAMTKLIIENLGFPSVIGGKPVALLGAAAGQIGAVKALEQLRGVLSHVGAIVLPGSVSVAGVQAVFDEDGTCKDAELEARIRGVATSLTDYLRQHVCPRVAFEQMVREEVERRLA